MKAFEWRQEIGSADCHLSVYGKFDVLSDSAALSHHC